jgi:mono/diheme cytochrome c family protein
MHAAGKRLYMTRSVVRLISALVLIGGTVYGQQPRAVPATEPAPRAALPRGNVDHGRYLVEQVVMCFECHSSRDENGDIIPTTRFYGGPVPVHPPWRADWAIVAPRIAGLRGYTDEQAIRLLTQGAIKRDGTPLRRPMPPFRMTPQDAADVIAYIRMF